MKVPSMSQLDLADIARGHPMLVFLYRPSCPYCHQMVPVMNAMVQHYSQYLNFVALRVDQDNALLAKYKRLYGPIPSGVPAFDMFLDGKKQRTHVGATDEQSLVNFINGQ